MQSWLKPSFIVNGLGYTAVGLDRRRNQCIHKNCVFNKIVSSEIMRLMGTYMSVRNHLQRGTFIYPCPRRTLFKDGLKSDGHFLSPRCCSRLAPPESSLSDLLHPSVLPVAWWNYSAQERQEHDDTLLQVSRACSPAEWPRRRSGNTETLAEVLLMCWLEGGVRGGGV